MNSYVWRIISKVDDSSVTRHNSVCPPSVSAVTWWFSVCSVSRQVTRDRDETVTLGVRALLINGLVEQCDAGELF